MQLNLAGTGKNASVVPLFLVPNKAVGDTFDAFAPGCQLLLSGRLYPNRNDYRMYVVPTGPLQVVGKEVSVNQVNLAGGVGYIGEQRLEDLFTFSLMVKAPSQPLLNHSWQDSMGLRVEAWGDDAKRLSSLLYVGRQMAVAGALRYNTWKAQDGTQRGTYQVRVRSSQYSVFGKNQQKAESASAPMVAHPVLPMQQQNLNTYSAEEEDDSIPF